MKFRLLFFVNIFVLISSLSFALEVREVGKERKLYTSENIDKALKSKFPDYRVPVSTDFVPSIYDMYNRVFSSTSAPFAVFGDFNLDGKIDAVLMLVEKRQKDLIFVSVLSEKKSNTLFVQKFYTDKFDKKDGNFTYIAKAPKGDLIFKSVTRGKSLSPRDVVKLQIYGLGPAANFFCFSDRRKMMIECTDYLEID